MRRALILLLLLAPAPALAALTCPDRLADPAPAPFERMGLGGGRGNGSALEEAWLVYGAPGEEMRPAPATSAPDSSEGNQRRFTNRWALETRDPMLLVCVYARGQWLRAAVPVGTRACVQSGDGRRMTMRCE